MNANRCRSGPGLSSWGAGMLCKRLDHAADDVLVRNVPGVGDRFIGMTRRDWVRK